MFLLLEVGGFEMNQCRGSWMIWGGNMTWETSIDDISLHFLMHYYGTIVNAFF
jgi:hypothetical protein